MGGGSRYIKSEDLLDEPEVSLSPQNQVKLAEEINKMSRYLGIQFIIAIHSPFMLGILNAKIYNLDTEDNIFLKMMKYQRLNMIFLSVSNRMKELKQMIPNLEESCADIDGEFRKLLYLEVRRKML